MFSIFFKCPACNSHMSAEDSDVGWEFSCPSCSTSLKVPSGDIIFTCKNCDKRMMAASSMVGERFTCPQCSKGVLIPKADKEIEVKKQPPEPEKPVTTRLSLPPELQRRLAKKNAQSSSAEKRLDDYLMMKWGPDVLAVATPMEKGLPTTEDQRIEDKANPSN